MPIDREAFYNRIAENIAKHKRHLFAVFPRNKDDGFCFVYTIGNQERDLPELLIIGVNASGLLNALSDKMIERGRAFENGEFVDMGGKYPVKIIDADDRAQRDYLIQCGQFYGHEDYAVQQVIGCDCEGRWPDDPQCAALYKVPILQDHAPQ